MGMEFKPVYYADKLNIINPDGDTGIVTLWYKADIFKEKLKQSYPALFEKNSPLVTITNLYGNGLPQMLSNLAYNPQITKLIVTGNDTKAVPSSDFLFNFLNRGTVNENIRNINFAKIKGTNFYIDPQLEPKMFSYLNVKRFDTSNLEGITEFANSYESINNKSRIRIKLAEPKFSDFPSDLTSHNIYTKTPLEAWIEVLYHLDRFGKNINLPKGVRRALFNLDVNISNPCFESEEKLRAAGFSPEELKEYQKVILDSNLQEGITYSYGNRLRKYWGFDSLMKVSERLKKDNLDRHGLISLWDTKKDLISEKGDSSSPCFSDIYFVKSPDDKLMVSANFRTHNAVSAWFTNLYGIRAIQEFVAGKVELESGQINLRSRWIGIDPNNARANSALEFARENRNIKLNVNDPKGYYEVVPDKQKNEIVVSHFDLLGIKLEELRGKNAEELKNKIRQIHAFSNTDHAMWIGMQLIQAQNELKRGSG